MEEKKLISSEKYKTGLFLALIRLIGIICAFYFLIDGIMYDIEYFNKTIYKYEFDSAFDYILEYSTEELAAAFLIPLISAFVLALIIKLIFVGHELTVTDKRVYGKTIFGKRVDLPMDSISAVASVQLFKGISIATSSGKINFLLIKNAKQIHDTLNKLLLDRQNKKTEILSAPATVNTDNADQIKKYKDLLDSGIITQEEFDKKKKELLGL